MKYLVLIILIILFIILILYNHNKCTENFSVINYLNIENTKQPKSSRKSNNNSSKSSYYIEFIVNFINNNIMQFSN